MRSLQLLRDAVGRQVAAIRACLGLRETFWDGPSAVWACSMLASVTALVGAGVFIYSVSPAAPPAVVVIRKVPEKKSLGIDERVRFTYEPAQPPPAPAAPDRADAARGAPDAPDAQGNRGAEPPMGVATPPAGAAAPGPAPGRAGTLVEFVEDSLTLATLASNGFVILVADRFGIPRGTLQPDAAGCWNYVDRPLSVGPDYLELPRREEFKPLLAQAQARVPAATLRASLPRPRHAALLAECDRYRLNKTSPEGPPAIQAVIVRLDPAGLETIGYKDPSGRSVYPE